MTHNDFDQSDCRIHESTKLMYEFDFLFVNKIRRSNIHEYQVGVVWHGLACPKYFKMIIRNMQIMSAGMMLLCMRVGSKSIHKYQVSGV